MSVSTYSVEAVLRACHGLDTNLMVVVLKKRQR